jgi:RimJ/RimL family protein N-acetyltransferase
MDSSPLFVGARVRLTAPRPEDAHTWARWYEDSEFARLFDSSAAYPRSASNVGGLLEGLSRDRTSFQFAIRLQGSEDLIGHVEIDSIQWNNRVGWVAIAIGEPRYQGQGYGYEAMQLLMRFAFHELNLHRLQLTVFSYNTRAIRLYEKLGFQREGVYREALLRDGQYHHMLLYGLLDREWRAARKG